MLYMLIVKASKNSEAGTAGNPTSAELIEAMSKYNEELVKAVVRIMAKGLQSSANGIRTSYSFSGEKPGITYGLFTNRMV